MGSKVTKPSNNSMVDRLAERSCFIHTPEIEGVFRAVDRAMYFEIEEGDSIDPYEDDPWKRGNLHISAPCIYAEVVGALKLESGLSFLNMGSGTGYLNTLIGLLIGPNGVNHGIELHGDVVDYAYKKLEQFKVKSRAIDKYDFAEPIFIKGNCLNLNPNLRYDRIYLGAACLLDREESIKRLVKPNGGILVMPFGNRLMRHTRVSENEWRSDMLMDVNFTQMIGQGEDTTMIDMPNPSAKSLKDLCRVAIRRHLREKTDIIYPNLLNSDNIDHRRAKQMKVSKLMLRSKRPTCSSESNNNTCSMSSSSSMSRDKTCRCPNGTKSRRRFNGGDRNSNNNITGRTKTTNQTSAIRGRVNAIQTRATASGASVIVDANEFRNVNQVGSSSTIPTTPREGRSSDLQEETRRVVTRSASKLRQSSTTDSMRNMTSSATRSNIDNSYMNQSSLTCSAVDNSSRVNEHNRQDPSPQPNTSNVTSKPPTRSDIRSMPRREYVISSSESTVGDSSGLDENEDEDNDNLVSNSAARDIDLRHSNFCARTRPFRQRREHHSDAFSGIILSNYARSNPQQGGHHASHSRCATLSEPDNSDDSSLDSDNMSSVRERWCVVRQRRKQRARFHVHRVRGKEPTVRINLDAPPLTSESSITSLADLILGDEYTSSGEDSWDNSSSVTSGQSPASFNVGDDGDEDNGSDDGSFGAANRSDFCITSARNVLANVEDDAYPDEAYEIDGILDDNILAGQMDTSQSSVSSFELSTEEVSYDSPQVNGKVQDLTSDSSHSRPEATNGGRPSALIDHKSGVSDEPVARRLRSRVINLPTSARNLTEDLLSTSENPESSTSGRSDHETTAGEASLRSTSARTRPLVLLPTTSKAGSTFQFRCPKHTSNAKRSLMGQPCGVAGSSRVVNCGRMNHQNHKHCRRHCKEAQCEQTDVMAPSASSSPSVAPVDGSILPLELETTTPSTSLNTGAKSLCAGTSRDEATSASATKSLSYIDKPMNQNKNSQAALDRKRKRQSSSDLSEISNEPSTCWPATTSSCQHSALEKSRQGPRRRVSRRLRCSCSHRSAQQQPQSSSSRLAASSRELDHSDNGTLIVMSGGQSAASSGTSRNNMDRPSSSARPPQLADEVRGVANAIHATTNAGRASLRTRFLLHNTWSSMFHRQIPTLDVLTRFSLHRADLSDQIPPIYSSGPTVNCLASLWPQARNSDRPMHRQQHISNSTSSTTRTTGLVSRSSSGSNLESRHRTGNSDRQPNAAATNASSAMDPSDGGNSSGARQAPRQRVNCCCCRYCRNVRRSRRERKQQLHHQSRRADEMADSRQYRSSRRRSRRKRETESEKYYAHMSGYIRQLPIPRVLHDYLNYERAF